MPLDKMDGWGSSDPSLFRSTEGWRPSSYGSSYSSSTPPQQEKMHPMTAVVVVTNGHRSETFWLIDRTDLSLAVKDVIESILEWENKYKLQGRTAVRIDRQTGGTATFGADLAQAWNSYRR